MPITLSVQREIDPEQNSASNSERVLEKIPPNTVLEEWVKAAQIDPEMCIEINLRIVSAAEIQELNKNYRNKDTPTNVLSFATQVPAGSGVQLLGDIVICAEIVAQEAEKFEKSLHDRWAHMLVHGCLHVQGLDHMQDSEREFMEKTEMRILKGLGISDPYQVN